MFDSLMVWVLPVMRHLKTIWTAHESMRMAFESERRMLLAGWSKESQQGLSCQSLVESLVEVSAVS